MIFVLEWNMYLHPGERRRTGRRLRTGLMGIGHLNVVRLLSRVPRERRVIIDYDGMYNDVITSSTATYNHPVPRRRAAADGDCTTASPTRSISRRCTLAAQCAARFCFMPTTLRWELPLEFRAKEYWE